MNASKTEFIRFKTPKRTVSKSQFIVAGSNIKLKNEVKYLGIIIDNKLTFETQTKNGLGHKSNSNNPQQPTQKMFKSAASCSCPKSF